MKLHHLLLAGLLLLAPGAFLRAQTPRYVVIGLGGGTVGNGINNAGEVAGTTSNLGGYDHATLFRAGRPPENLAPLDILSDGSGINIAAQVSGSRYPDLTTRFAALFLSGSQPRDLGHSFGDSYCGGINNAGQAAGTRDITGDGPYHATLFDVDGTQHDLGSISWPSSSGNSINNLGQVAGGSHIANGLFHAALFSVGSAPQDLGSLGGYSQGSGINDAGQVVGVSEIHTTYGAYAYQATLFRAGSAPRELAGLGSFASAINNSGQVAGYYAPMGAFLFLNDFTAIP